MDNKPPAVIELKKDEFEQVARPVGAKDERTLRLIISVREHIGDERVAEPVLYVLVNRLNNTRRLVDLHTRLV